MKRIYSLLLLALMGAGVFASAQEGAAAPAPAPAPQGKVSRDRFAELTAFDAKLDQDYAALRNDGVLTAAGIFVEAKGRIKSALSIVERKPGSKESAAAFTACSAYVVSTFLQFEREANLYRAAKMNESRDSLLNVLHNLHEAISRIEGGRAYKLAQELEASKAKSSLLQGDLEAKKAELAAERARLRKVMQDAQKRFGELQSALISVSKDARGTIISMADILFESGKATLKPELKESLAKIAGILIVYKEPNIVVEGHTDNVGPKNADAKEYNQKLSEDRANSVLGYLVEQGVPATRLTAVGYGLEKPIAENTTKEGRAKNRRVELVIQEKPLDDDGAEVAAPAPAPAQTHPQAPAVAPAQAPTPAPAQTPAAAPAKAPAAAPAQAPATAPAQAPAAAPAQAPAAAPAKAPAAAPAQAPAAAPAQAPAPAPAKAPAPAPAKAPAPAPAQAPAAAPAPAGK